MIDLSEEEIHFVFLNYNMWPLTNYIGPTWHVTLWNKRAKYDKVHYFGLSN